MDPYKQNNSEELFYLSDENGEQMAFHLLDVVMVREKEYLVLLPAEGPYTDEVVILQRFPEENGEESYADPEDEAALREVYAIFRDRAGDRFLYAD